MKVQLSDEEKNDGYSCCHIKFREKGRPFIHCLKLKNEDIEPTRQEIINNLKEISEESDVNIVCSEEELENLKEVEDNSTSNHCGYLYPYSEKHCFIRKISDSERNGYPGLTPNKCCYLKWFINEDMNDYCIAIDDTNIDYYKEFYRNSDIICPDSEDSQDLDDSQKSASSFLHNIIYGYIIFIASIL